jgi:hypothetical protein
MSYKSDYKINGFFEYVVPPLDGFGWQDGFEDVDYSRKNTFQRISLNPSARFCVQGRI